jgi:hypothetical protein
MAKDQLLALVANIRLGCTCLTMSNEQSYYIFVLTNTVKSFIQQAPVEISF